MKPLFRKIDDPFVSFKLKKRPEAPKDNTDIVDKDIYQEKIKLYVARDANLRHNVEKSFGVI